MCNSGNGSMYSTFDHYRNTYALSTLPTILVSIIKNNVFRSLYAGALYLVCKHLSQNLQQNEICWVRGFIDQNRSKIYTMENKCIANNTINSMKTLIVFLVLLIIIRT